MSFVWTLKEDGQEVLEKSFGQLSVPPRGKKTITIDLSTFDFKKDKEYFLKISAIANKEDGFLPIGHEVAWEQFLIQEQLLPEEEEVITQSKSFQVNESAKYYSISGKNFSIRVDKSSGAIVEYFCLGKCTPR